MPLEYHVVAFGEEMQTLATIDIGVMWDRILGEFLGEWARTDRQRLPSAEVEREMLAFMENLSDKHEIDLARKSSSVAYNQGRAAEIRTASEQGTAEWVIRSEILDENTCQPCALYDGAAFEIGTPSFDEFMPPAKCKGGDRCRGFYVAVPAEMAA